MPPYQMKEANVVIDVKKVKEAQETIREATDELFLIVKKYFEENRTLDIQVEKRENIEKFFNKIPAQISLEIEGLEILLTFTRCNGDYYSITCEELDLYGLEATDKDLSIHGEVTFNFICLEDGTKASKTYVFL